MSSRENPSSPSWTYRMEVSPTGAAPSVVPPHLNDPVQLLHVLVNLQSQTIEMLRQMGDLQKAQLELLQENTAFARDQRQRQGGELEKWQQSHGEILDDCKESLGKLETVHAAVMRDMAEYVAENYENLVEGDFSLSDFVDKFGPKLAHLNTIMSILRPLAAAAKKPEGA